ncbi:50S ribosomal protein L27 [Candidatus Parcubacteria bacterium]|nr:MAG: 50S ribosomal protein L27 [Candidatus Parcubacteria bacterium]
MAHRAAAGAAKQGRDSQSKRLGVKLFAGEKAKNGNIIIRQRGTKFLPGKNVKIGSDHTIYAIKDGVVKFESKIKSSFDGNSKPVKIVHVI